MEKKIDSVVIKPCPFCGGIAMHTHFTNDPGPSEYVGCVSCNAFIRKDTKKDAVMAWNQRVLSHLSEQSN